MQNSAPRLTLARTLLYSMASAGLNIMGMTMDTWLLYFYAPPQGSGRAAHLPAALVGALLLPISLWDAAIDPFIGHWSDTTRSRCGRRRPFLILGAPAMALFLVLVWMPPAGASPALTALYLVLMVTGFRTALSLVGIPYDGTLPEMAPQPTDRVQLSYWKNVLGIVGVLIAAVAAAPLFETAGPVAMGAVAGGVGMVAIWLTLLGLREAERPAGETMGVLEGMRATLENRQFIYLALSTLFVYVAYGVVLADLPYFATLVVGASESSVSLLQGAMIIVMAATGPLWAMWNRRVPQRRLLNAAMLGTAVVLGLSFLVGSVPGVPALAQGLAMMGLSGIALGGYFIVVYALMGSVVDYDEMLTGNRREANYYGTFSFARGLGGAAATLILPLLLQGLGYSRANPLGARAAFLVAAAFVLIGLGIFRGYRLGDTPKETRANLGLPEA